MRLCVMTWNVRYFGHGTGGLRASDDWMRKIAWVLAGLPRIPDVLALQEVEHGSLRGGPGLQLDRFLALFDAALRHQRRPEAFVGLYYPAHRYALGARALYTTGLALVISKRHTLETHNADQPHDITSIRFPRLARVKQRRIAAYARIQPFATGEPLHLVNTHLSLPAFLEGAAPHRLPERMGHGSNQVQEIDNLARFLEPFQQQRVVVMGDFNSAPGSPAHARLLEHGLVDAHLAAATPDAVARAQTAGFLHKRMHIDHVFSTPDVRWDEVVAHDLDLGPFRGLSDHAPKTGWMSAA